MRSLLAATFVAYGLVGGPLPAQGSPFDMSGERSTPPSPVTVPETIQPSDSAAKSPTPPATSDPLAATNGRRYVVPFDRLPLAAESANREWTIYLTPDEAQAATTLNYGYQNSVVVAPEASTLSVLVNDTVIGEEPIRSPNEVATRRYDIPPGLMRPGSNKISFRASQRHRTDCTVQSTFELWSQILPDRTFIEFDRARMKSAPSINDVRAVGVDSRGQTRFNIVAPKLEQSAAAPPLLGLAQALGMLASMPNQVFNFATELPAQSGPGEMTIAVGTAAELERILPKLPDGARTGGVTTFVEHPATGKPLLVLTGPTWEALQGLVEGMLAPVDRPQNTPRDALTTQRWFGANTPLLTSGARMTFASLGLRTAEFSGRRFRTSFTLGMPADFYGDAYGEARILLDAAYTAAVQPGSQIDIYVNGNIAATVPMTTKGGDLLQHLPINFTMRHFRPGVNLIEMEAILFTHADAVCAPGTTADNEPRFALFDTSELQIPNFARIAQLPNLAAASGTGFPFGRGGQTVDLFIDRNDTDTLSATATLLSKLAVTAGRPIRLVPKASALAMSEGDAIFVGPISQIPPLAIARTHLSEESAKTWGISDGTASQSASTDMLDQWRQKTSSAWSAPFAAVNEWLKKTIDLPLTSLRFAPREEASFVPPDVVSLVMAQGLSPSENGAWLLLTAPTTDQLRQGTAAMTEQSNWEQLAGSLTHYAASTKEIKNRAVSQFSFVPTQPWSFWNARLITANWLSTNILSYALLLVGFSILLGLATSALLRRFGKRGID